jgi:hypothetical protein
MNYVDDEYHEGTVSFAAISVFLDLLLSNSTQKEVRRNL